MLLICCNNPLNHDEINKEPQKITNTKPFIDKYNWQVLNNPSEKTIKEKLMRII